jgi:hypothetical protein
MPPWRRRTGRRARGGAGRAVGGRWCVGGGTGPDLSGLARRRGGVGREYRGARRAGSAGARRALPRLAGAHPSGNSRAARGRAASPIGGLSHRGHREARARGGGDRWSRPRARRAARCVLDAPSQPSFTISGLDEMSARSTAARARAASAGMGQSLPVGRVLVSARCAAPSPASPACRTLPSGIARSGRSESPLSAACHRGSV